MVCAKRYTLVSDFEARRLLTTRDSEFKRAKSEKQLLATRTPLAQSAEGDGNHSLLMTNFSRNDADKERFLHDATQKDSKEAHYESTEGTVMLGYVSSSLGSMCMNSCALLSLVWVFAVLLTIYGYYDGCEFRGIDCLCFQGRYSSFGTFSNNAQVFFAAWVVGLFWFATLILSPEKVRMFCLLPVPLSVATMVWVWSEGDAEVMTPTTSGLIRFLRRAKDWCNNGKVKNGHSALVCVQTVTGSDGETVR